MHVQVLGDSRPGSTPLVEAHVDTTRQVGSLDGGDRIGLAENTLVVITADHGEGLMQHGHPEHGIHIYEEAVRVPLLFRWPNRIPEGLVFAEPVELIDLMPTILELAGLSTDDVNSQGRSLAAALRGEAALEPTRPVFLHRRHYDGSYEGEIWAKGEKFGIRVGPWKYIEGDEERTKELFNLDEDPQEVRNVFDQFPDQTAQLARRLAQWKRASATGTSTPGTIADEDIQRLRALGYTK